PHPAVLRFLVCCWSPASRWPSAGADVPCRVPHRRGSSRTTPGYSATSSLPLRPWRRTAWWRTDLATLCPWRPPRQRSRCTPVRLPTYRAVRCTGVYPHTDMRYYGADGGFEYDFIVNPGGDPGRIRFTLAGATGLSLGAGGSLTARLQGGAITQHRPTIYQES